MSYPTKRTRHLFATRVIPSGKAESIISEAIEEQERRRKRKPEVVNVGLYEDIERKQEAIERKAAGESEYEANEGLGV